MNVVAVLIVALTLMATFSNARSRRGIEVDALTKRKLMDLLRNEIRNHESRSGSGDDSGSGSKGFPGSGSGDEKEGPPEDKDGRFGLVEFYSFLGRCASNNMFFELRNESIPTEGMLAEACPLLWETADRIWAAGDKRPKAELLLEDLFPLMQCANMVAELQNVYGLASMMPEGHVETMAAFWEGIEPVVMRCEELFGNAEEEIASFESKLIKLLSELDSDKNERGNEPVSRLLLRIAGQIKETLRELKTDH